MTQEQLWFNLSLLIMNYCLAFYGTTNNALLHRVQKLQNFAAKICVRGEKISDHATPFITQLQWLKIKEICFWCGFRCLQDLKVFPEWHLQLPMISEATYNKHTRQHDKLYIPHTNTDSGERSLTVLGPRMWNKLPTHVTRSHLACACEELSVPHNQLQYHMLINLL